jgi:hypothetical protein
MKTYFITIHVRPLPENPLITKIEEARAHFWIVDASPEKAMERATRHLASYRWKLETVEKGPVYGSGGRTEGLLESKTKRFCRTIRR